jgi:ribosomal protein L32E
LKRKKTTQVPAVDNKKKEVVRVIFPHGYIDYMITNPGKMRELSDEEMDNCPLRFRQTYAITKVAHISKPSSMSTELLALPMTKRRLHKTRRRPW